MPVGKGVDGPVELQPQREPWRIAARQGPLDEISHKVAGHDLRIVPGECQMGKDVHGVPSTGRSAGGTPGATRRPSRGEVAHVGSGLGGMQCLIDVGNDVGHILDADGKADEIRRYPGRETLFIGELLVRG